MTRIEILEALLDRISVSCDTLANFAALNAEGCDDRQRGMYAMHAVQSMAERMGAIACMGLANPAVGAARHLIGHDVAQALVGPEAPQRGASEDAARSELRP